MELTKSQKKTAREIIEKGLQKEFEKGLSDADKILTDWKNNPTPNNADSYHALFKSIHDFDKKIASRYDGMTGSSYLLVIIGQLRDGFITDKVLEGFPEELQQILKTFME
jgi:hypothetical protein